MHRRIGAMDLRIAAIAITQNAILLTQNLKDFTDIQDLKVEDWSY
jgi:tRNA(fMet)-specific endonuclease VapC